MNITHLISSLNTGYGGPVIALEGLCRGLQQSAQIETRVIDSGNKYGGESLAGQLADLGVSAHSGSLPLKQRIAIVKDSDLIHVHGVWDPAFHDLITLCRQTNTPYIIRPCGMLDPWSLKQKRFKKWGYRTLRVNRHLRDAVAIHFTTNAEADLANAFCRPEQRLIEPNGVFLDDFTTQRSMQLKQQWGIPENASLAIFLGRIHPKKGIEFLVRALRLQPELNLHLVVAGSGDEAYVRQISRLAGEDSRIHVVGMLHGDDKTAALATGDFFVLTSYQENFGNAVVEALASGTPVLISPGVNLVDVIQERRVGEVVVLEDQAIADTLQRWTQQPQLVADYASRCRSTAGELFDWNEIGKRWIGHYQRLITAASQ